jgi:hypothetical protein
VSGNHGHILDVERRSGLVVELLVALIDCGVIDSRVRVEVSGEVAVTRPLWWTAKTEEVASTTDTPSRAAMATMKLPWSGRPTAASGT